MPASFKGILRLSLLLSAVALLPLMPKSAEAQRIFVQQDFPLQDFFPKDFFLQVQRIQGLPIKTMPRACPGSNFSGTWMNSSRNRGIRKVVISNDCRPKSPLRIKILLCERGDNCEGRRLNGTLGKNNRKIFADTRPRPGINETYTFVREGNSLYVTYKRQGRRFNVSWREFLDKVDDQQAGGGNHWRKPGRPAPIWSDPDLQPFPPGRNPDLGGIVIPFPTPKPTHRWPPKRDLINPQGQSAFLNPCRGEFSSAYWDTSHKPRLQRGFPFRAIALTPQCNTNGNPHYLAFFTPFCNAGSRNCPTLTPFQLTPTTRQSYQGLLYYDGIRQTIELRAENGRVVLDFNPLNRPHVVSNDIVPLSLAGRNRR